MRIALDNFTADEQAVVKTLDLDNLPRHIAIIMDGNGRWATAQGLPRAIGHHAGTESARCIVRACNDLGVEYVTLYTFSTENWRRPETEVHTLMQLIEEQLRYEMAELHKENVRIRHLGRQEELPASLRAAIHEGIERTARNTGLTLSLALNYSGRAELLDAARRLAADAAAGKIDPATIREDDVASRLYAPDIPDPDLLIRTAGELRISNYLLWQIAYSEFWVTPILWPDFRAPHLLEALVAYQKRLRKFGEVLS